MTCACGNPIPPKRVAALTSLNIRVVCVECAEPAKYFSLDVEHDGSPVICKVTPAVRDLFRAAQTSASVRFQPHVRGGSYAKV